MAFMQGAGFAIFGESLENITNSLIKMEMAEKKQQQELLKVQESNKAFKLFLDRVNTYTSNGFSQSVAFTKAARDIAQLTAETGTISMSSVLAMINQYKAFAEYNTIADATLKVLKDTGSHVSASTLIGIQKGDPEAITKANQKAQLALEIDDKKRELEFYQQTGKVSEVQIDDYVNKNIALLNHNFNDILDDIYSGNIKDLNQALELYNNSWKSINDNYLSDILKKVPKEHKELAYKKQKELEKVRQEQLTSLVTALKSKQELDKAITEGRITDIKAATEMSKAVVTLTENGITVYNLTKWGFKNPQAMMQNLTVAMSLTPEGEARVKLAKRINDIAKAMSKNRTAYLNTINKLTYAGSFYNKILNNEPIENTDIDKFMTVLLNYRNELKKGGEDVDIYELLALQKFSPVDFKTLKTIIEKRAKELPNADLYISLLDEYLDKLRMSEILNPIPQQPKPQLTPSE